jgi:hypothetical protein
VPRTGAALPAAPDQVSVGIIRGACVSHEYPFREPLPDLFRMYASETLGGASDRDRLAFSDPPRRLGGCPYRRRSLCPTPRLTTAVWYRMSISASDPFNWYSSESHGGSHVFLLIRFSIWVYCLRR